MAGKTGIGTKVVVNRDGNVTIYPPSEVYRYVKQDGDVELRHVQSISITIPPDDFIRADICLAPEIVRVDSKPKFSFFDVVSRQMKEISRVEFADGTHWCAGTAKIGPQSIDEIKEEMKSIATSKLD